MLVSLILLTHGYSGAGGLEVVLSLQRQQQAKRAFSYPLVL
jgi:hypothetical protein